MKLLAAVDLSKASAYVLEVVHRVATATSAEVYLLHVMMPLPKIADPGFHADMEQENLSERYLDEHDQLTQLTSQLLDVGIAATALLAQGDPAKTILGEARRLDVELIVLGTHGHGLLLDALLGSVSAGVLRHSTLPVLVVPVKGI